MFQVSNQQFQDLINQSMDSLPPEHVKNIQNVAILVEDFPSNNQRQQLKLNNSQTLLGLYEGVPLARRQGVQKVLPDKITLFKVPLESQAGSLEDLKEQIRHTLWHEIAHSYGHDHQSINSLEA